MMITRTGFDTKRSQGKLRLALIGMSNIGKSHWSGQIVANDDFTCFEVDDAIQASQGQSSMEEAAKWLGFPYDEQYPTTSQQYLSLEALMTLSALIDHEKDQNQSELEKREPERHGKEQACNLVLDTTGSFVHLDTHILSQIKEQCLIVYLRASESNFDVLINRFNSSPKPLIWGEYFNTDTHDQTLEGLMACYPALLQGREKLYEQWADITLDVSSLKSTHDTDFLTALRDSLPNE